MGQCACKLHLNAIVPDTHRYTHILDSGVQLLYVVDLRHEFVTQHKVHIMSMRAILCCIVWGHKALWFNGTGANDKNWFIVQLS